MALKTQFALNSHHANMDSNKNNQKVGAEEISCAQPAKNAKLESLYQLDAMEHRIQNAATAKYALPAIRIRSNALVGGTRFAPLVTTAS